MGRTVMCAVLALATLLLGPIPASVADDPGPGVVLGPAPRLGVDATIRAAGSSVLVGEARYGSGQRISQTIRRRERAVSYVRICSNVAGRIRVHGTGGGSSFKVRYLVGRHDVTSRVVAGSFRIRPRTACEREIRVVVRWRPGSTRTARTFRVRAIPPTGGRDTVATRVSVVR